MKPNFLRELNAIHKLIVHSSYFVPFSNGDEITAPRLSPDVRSYGDIVRLVGIAVPSVIDILRITGLN